VKITKNLVCLKKVTLAVAVMVIIVEVVIHIVQPGQPVYSHELVNHYQPVC